MGITGPGVEVVGDGSPAVIAVQVHRSRGVVGVEHDAVGHDVVGGVKGVVRRTCAVDEPKHVRTFQSVRHASTVGVGVGPVGSGLILNGIGDAVTVEVVGLNVVGRIVFWVGSVKVFCPVVHAALVAVKVR